MNEISYMGVKPYEVVKVISEKTIEIRSMNYELSNDIDLKFHIDGFCVSCSNQETQQYKYTSNEDAEVVRVRLHKDGYFHCKYGSKYLLSDKPLRFYNYSL